MSQIIVEPLPGVYALQAAGYVGSGFPCPWEIDPETCQIADLDPEDPVFLRSLSTASAMMNRMSAYTIGLCDAMLRPLRMCPECRSWCCGGTDALRLYGYSHLSIWDVTSVRLGPTEYDPDTWHFERSERMLYRVPPDVWPRRDEKWSAPGEGEAFVVDVKVGSPPDDWAMDVLARLVKELVLSCRGAKCRLPSNATTVTSQGVTVQLRDQEINTFIPELAAWVHAVNPHNARLPAAVFSPDVAPALRGGYGGRGGCCG